MHPQLSNDSAILVYDFLIEHLLQFRDVSGHHTHEITRLRVVRAWIKDHALNTELLKALRSDQRDDEAKDAILAYENAHIAWSIERPGTLLLFRELLPSENYQLVATAFDESLVGKIFRPIRRCLTKSLAHGDDKEAVSNTLEACRIDELLELSSTCSLPLAAAVSDLAKASSEWVSTEHIEDVQEQARDSIGKKCP